MRQKEKGVRLLAIWALVLLTAIAFVGCAEKKEPQQVGGNRASGPYSPGAYNPYGGALVSTADPNRGDAELNISNQSVFADFLRATIYCGENHFSWHYVEFAAFGSSCNYLSSRTVIGFDLEFRTTGTPEQNEIVDVLVYFADATNPWSPWSPALRIPGQYKWNNADQGFRILARDGGGPYLDIVVDGTLADMSDFDTSIDVDVKYAGSVMATGTVYRHY